MSPVAKVMVEVVGVTQSPMNAARWVLDLACRHELWVTARSKPRAKKARCTNCEVVAAVSGEPS